MAFKKYTKRFASIKRRARRSRKPRSKARRAKTYFYKRTVLTEITVKNNGFQSIASNLTGPVYNSWDLSQVPNYTDFTNLYDKFKICGLKVKYVFNRNISEYTLNKSELPTLCAVFDDNDGTPLATENEACEYNLYRNRRLENPIVHYFRPKPMDSDNLNIGHWLPTFQFQQIKWRGMKFAVDTVGTANDIDIGTLKVYTTFYIACRVPK